MEARILQVDLEQIKLSGSNQEDKHNIHNLRYIDLNQEEIEIYQLQLEMKDLRNNSLDMSKERITPEIQMEEVILEVEE